MPDAGRSRVESNGACMPLVLRLAAERSYEVLARKRTIVIVPLFERERRSATAMELVAAMQASPEKPES